MLHPRKLPGQLDIDAGEMAKRQRLGPVILAPAIARFAVALPVDRTIARRDETPDAPAGGKIGAIDASFEPSAVGVDGGRRARLVTDPIEAAALGAVAHLHPA